MSTSSKNNVLYDRVGISMNRQKKTKKWSNLGKTWEDIEKLLTNTFRGATTISITTLSITTFIIMIFSITTFTIMTFGKIKIKCDSQHNDLILSVAYSQCHVCWVSLMLSITYAECHLCWVSLFLSVNYKPFMLSVVMLNVVGPET